MKGASEIAEGLRPRPAPPAKAGTFATYATDGVPTISPSQAAVFSICSQRWKYGYGSAGAQTSSWPMLFGSTCHAVVEEGLKSKAAGLAVSSDALGRLAADVVEILADDALVAAAVGGRTVPSRMGWQADDCVRRTWDWVEGSELVPLQIETWSRVPLLDGRVRLSGRLDAVFRARNGECVLVDWKFPRLPPLEAGPLPDNLGLTGRNHVMATSHRLALLGYAAGLQGSEAEPSYVATVSAWKRRRPDDEPAAPSVSLVQAGKAVPYVVGHFEDVARRIESGDIRPEPERAGKACSPPGCSYWDACPGGASRSDA